MYVYIVLPIKKRKLTYGGVSENLDTKVFFLKGCGMYNLFHGVPNNIMIYV